MYYSLTAVLCLEPIAFKKHKDTIGYFNKNYVHAGMFPNEIGRSISKAAKVRHASDYDEFYIASKEEAQKQIQTAKIVIDLVGEFISQK
ncbi:MAG: HEPN domain-containing protein [Eubacterium sp.]|nr:HEPN domain-containing protein [Eubacterium sp.]